MSVDQEFTDLYARWCNEGITSLAMIKGYAETLLNGALGDLADEQRKAVEVICRCSKAGINSWHHPGEYLSLSAILEDPFEAISLPKIIEEALSYLREYSSIDNVRIAVPDTLRPVRSKRQLAIAIRNLMIHHNPQQRGISPALRVNPTEDAAVLVQIQIENERDLAPSLFHPGTRLYVANSIIEQHGRGIELQCSDQGVEFRFVLPLWQDCCT